MWRWCCSNVWCLYGGLKFTGFIASFNVVACLYNICLNLSIMLYCQICVLELEHLHVSPGKCCTVNDEHIYTHTTNRNWTEININAFGSSSAVQQAIIHIDDNNTIKLSKAVGTFDFAHLASFIINNQPIDLDTAIFVNNAYHISIWITFIAFLKSNSTNLRIKTILTLKIRIFLFVIESVFVHPVSPQIFVALN